MKLSQADAKFGELLTRIHQLNTSIQALETRSQQVYEEEVSMSPQTNQMLVQLST